MINISLFLSCLPLEQLSVPVFSNPCNIVSQEECRVRCMAGQHHISAGKHSPADGKSMDFGVVRERTGEVAGGSAEGRAFSGTSGRGVIVERARDDSRDSLLL